MIEIKWDIMMRDDILKMLQDHRADLERLNVKSLALFGSAARGEAKQGSDLDFLIEFSKPIGLFKFLDVKAYLEKLLGRKVDLVTPDALKKQLRQKILANTISVL